MQEEEALNKEEVSAQRYVAMMGEHRCGDGIGSKGRCTRRWGRARSPTLQDSSVGPVDEQGTLSIVGSHRTVSDEVVAQDVKDLRLGGASQLAIKIPGAIGGFHLPPCEQFSLPDYS